MIWCAPINYLHYYVRAKSFGENQLIIWCAPNHSARTK